MAPIGMLVPDSPLVARVVASPNMRARTPEERIEFIVIHGTWMVGDEGALARLTDPVAEVSCHYYITRTGEVIQLVSERDVAWHAGKSEAVNAEGQLVQGLNGWSIGIEIANSGPFGGHVPTPEQEAHPDWDNVEPYTPAQYAAVKALVEDIVARHPGISRERVLGHEDVSPGRKSDPGVHFEWGWWR